MGREDAEGGHGQNNQKGRQGPAPQAIVGALTNNNDDEQHRQQKMRSLLYLLVVVVGNCY